MQALLSQADAAGLIDWDVSVDATIARAHQHATNTTRLAGDPANYMKQFPEPGDHAIGRSRGGLTTKLHLVCDGRGRPLSMMITAGNINDTTMMTAITADSTSATTCSKRS